MLFEPVWIHPEQCRKQGVGVEMPIRLVFSPPFDPWSTSSESDISRAIELLPPFQKEVYTLLQKAYLKTPDGYNDNSYTI